MTRIKTNFLRPELTVLALLSWMIATPVAVATESTPWRGYAIMNYSQYDFFKNVQDDSADRRARMDLERVVLETVFRQSDRVNFEIEIEIEHGGTGSSLEYEADEFGEYEHELEKGGEIVIEKAQLEIHSSPLVNWHIGHVVVPFGMVNRYTHPGDYYTTRRSLAETALIPNTWHESGVELYGRLGGLNYRSLLVNGLDSSGFSSQNWVAGGYQTRLEFANADDLALVGVLDYPLGRHGLIGAAGYYGNSANNRHQQNLNVAAAVAIAELHVRYRLGPMTLRGQYMHGRLQNAARVTEANKNLVNQSVRGVSATPVGSAATAWYVAAGVDVAHLLGKGSGVELFGRMDSFDTMASVDAGIVDDPRYDRTVYTLGFNHRTLDNIVVKGEYAQHHHAGSIANRAQYIALGLGVDF